MDAERSSLGLARDTIKAFAWRQWVKPSKTSGQPISTSTFCIRDLQNTKQEGMHLNNANGKLCQIPHIVTIWTFSYNLSTFVAKCRFKYKVRQLQKETTSLQLQEYPHLPITGASYLTPSHYSWSAFRRHKNRAIIAFKAAHIYRYHMCTP
jgi:hypothetical protein